MLTFSKYDASGVNGEGTVELYPKKWRGDGATGIVFCHGANGTEMEARTPDGTKYNMYALVDALVAAGFPVISCYLGGNHWGNAAGVTKLGAAVAYLQSTMGASTAKVGFVAQSMGHLVAMNWAAQNRAKTAFVVSSMGVADLNDIHGQAAYTASIDAAYGGNYTDATYGASYNPTVNAAAKYAGLNWMGWYGASDTTALPSKADALRTAIGATATLNQVTGQHDWTTVGRFDTDAIVDFAKAHD